MIGIVTAEAFDVSDRNLPPVWELMAPRLAAKPTQFKVGIELGPASFIVAVARYVNALAKAGQRGAALTPLDSNVVRGPIRTMPGCWNRGFAICR